MAMPVSYVLCGTPRTGSTLLCSLLSSTGVLGRPESYFREPDEARWAEQFRVPTDRGRALDYRAFVARAHAAGSTPNGVLAARIMWGSLDQLLLRLGHPSGASDLAVLERTFGPLAFVHLRRDGLQAIEPLVVTYEEVVSDPRAAVAGIAGHLSVELPQGWRPRSEHRKQADEINGAHEEALREALGAEGS